MTKKLHLQKAQATKNHLVSLARDQHGAFAPEGELGASAEEILVLDSAITRLHEEYPEHAEIALMRLFTELTLDEITGILGIAKSTVERRWRMARAILRSCADEHFSGTVYARSEHLDLVRAARAKASSVDPGSERPARTLLE